MIKSGSTLVDIYAIFYVIRKIHIWPILMNTLKGRNQCNKNKDFLTILMNFSVIVLQKMYFNLKTYDIVTREMHNAFFSLIISIGMLQLSKV